MAEKKVDSSGVDCDQLMKELGQFNRFHMTNYVMAALVTFTAAHYATNYVFLAADVSYRNVNGQAISVKIGSNIPLQIRSLRELAMAEKKVDSSGVDCDQLMKELGQFNRFHMTNYVMAALVTFTAAHYATNYVFLAADVSYRNVNGQAISVKIGSNIPLQIRSLRELAMAEKKVDSSGVDCDQLMKELGQFNRFHMTNYVMAALVTFTAAHYATNYVFLAADVSYRCVVPECEASNSSVFAAPWTAAALPAHGREHRCTRRVPLDPTLPCEPTSAYSEDVLPCDQWLYSSANTIVTEFNLACQEWKRTLVGTVHNIGMLVSLPILGYISDRWGRKTALILSCVLVGAIGSLKAFSINYEMYVVVEFLETVAGASAFPAAFIMTIELLGQEKRVLTTAFLGIMLVIGGLSFALLAKTFQYWRTFILVVYPPSLLFLLYIYFLPESIRWHLSKGNKAEALEIVTKAAKMNNITLSEETMRQLQEAKAAPVDEKKEEESGLWMQVFRSPIIMRRLAICSWWWITCTFVFYGLAINSVSLAGDKYTNYMLVVSVEVIAVVTNALVLDRIGRKRTLLIAYIVCGISCVAITFVPPTMSWLTTLLYLVGKIAITQAFSGVYMYTSELFPTHARHSLLGFCSMVGRLGSIVAPQMPLLAIYVDWLPSVLFGSTALVAAALMMTTPETLNTRLPDTIQEAEELANQHKSKPETLEMKTSC